MNSLDRFFTNTDSNVFALQGLPDVVAGALFSRYSRSPSSLRTLFVEEFAPELDLDSFTQKTVHHDRADAFYDRVLGAYGDDSIAELGGAHLALEGISQIAAKAIEDSRIGLSYLEKSTRYVKFAAVDRIYPYYLEPTIATSRKERLYRTVMNALFDGYNSGLKPTTEWLKTIYPKTTGATEKAYLNSIRAKALDLWRGLLPMSTKTNVGIYGNGRAYEYLICKLRASKLTELQVLSGQIQAELDKVIPAFVKRAKSDKGLCLSDYLGATKYDRQIDVPYGRTSPKIGVKRIKYDLAGECRVATAIAYPTSGMSWENTYRSISQLGADAIKGILACYVGERASRHQRPGRAFEAIDYLFEIVSDVGSYRDLQRHRICTIERQSFTTSLGFDIPEPLFEGGLSDIYARAMEIADTGYSKTSIDFPAEAEYLVPFGYKVRWTLKLNLREAFHLIELRTSKQGHESYRYIAQQVYLQIKEVHPYLAELMSFVDLNTYGLNRIDSEIKQATKETL